jgi:hypothetical protein
MAREYIQLVKPAERAEKGFKPLDYFARALADPANTTLFVFDNFETVRSPIELQRWLDTHVRSPNKILITTRSRDFKGDYWVEVSGMTEEQFAELAQTSAREIGVTHLLDDSYIDELYDESGGHPYIAKVLLGELARAGKQQKVARIMASQDRILDALFERTFTQLAPAAQRVFLTLSSWRSFVPMIALEAAITRPENERIDVDDAVDELRRGSLLDTATTESGDLYLSIPLSAALFGKRKLATSPWQSAVEADAEVLRLFGAVQTSGTRHGVEVQVERLFGNVAQRLQKQPNELERYRPVLEYVASDQPVGWVLLAQMIEENRFTDAWADEAADAYSKYLEVVQTDGQIWRALASICEHKGDYLRAAHALVRRARLPDSPYADVSYAANKVNAYLYEGVLGLDTDERRILITSLTDTMTKRKDEADATDLSRLAWLLMNIGRQQEAGEIVHEGLALEPSNLHCQKLAERLKPGQRTGQTGTHKKVA